MSITSRVEDYLEAILDIEMTGRVATVTQIAKNLDVTKATITAALKKMKENGLLHHEHYGDVLLTDEGRAKALAVYRRHEFLTDFFARIMGFDRERAGRVACVMEHEIDEASEMRLAAFADAMAAAERRGDEWFKALHDAIQHPKPLSTPLCLMPDGSGGTIARVTAQHDLRKRLTASGFVPGAVISGIRRNESSKHGLSFSCEMNGMMVAFGIAEASSIWLYQPE